MFVSVLFLSLIIKSNQSDLADFLIDNRPLVPSAVERILKSFLTDRSIGHILRSLLFWLDLLPIKNTRASDDVLTDRREKHPYTIQFRVNSTV